MWKEVDINPISWVRDSSSRGYSMSFSLCKGAHLVGLNPWENSSPSLMPPLQHMFLFCPTPHLYNTDVYFHTRRAFSGGCKGMNCRIKRVRNQRKQGCMSVFLKCRRGHRANESCKVLSFPLCKMLFLSFLPNSLNENKIR